MANSASQTNGSFENQSMTLTELLTQVGQVLRREMKQRYWFTAEITSIKRHVSGHIYIDLSHTNDGGQTAKTSATIWNRNTSIVSNFEAQTSIRFDRDLEVMLLGEISFNPQYGFKINIVDINASFSVGAFELKLREIRKRLQELNEDKLNKQLTTPLDFTRVAVIAPSKAAGLSDFKTKAERLQHHGLCHFDYFEAMFQGVHRENSIIMAFTELVQNNHSYDAVCLIRGGGDRASLNELAEAKLARAVCRCPYPVFTGIGHETDTNLLDEYAHNAFSTPSMVVSHVFDTIVRNARDASENFSSVQYIARQISSHAKQDVEHKWSGICENKAIILSTWRNSLEVTIERIFTTSKQAVADSRYHVAEGYNALMRDTRNNVVQQKEYVNQLNEACRYHSVRHVQLARQQNRDMFNRLYTGGSKQITTNKFDLARHYSEIQSRAGTHAQASKQELNHAVKVMFNGAKHSLNAQRDKVTNNCQLIDAFNPQNVLARGFALVTNDAGEIVKQISQVDPYHSITVQLKDGTVTANPVFIQGTYDE
ncbi:exodeoxyribonuclease VII large subunit [Photobacterium japonica]|uniref:exodeoxyribonuclease VII large subunit n=1 Tax=Photobacterium japonica TaxID=2910235 RepID=UPI003D10CFD8